MDDLEIKCPICGSAKNRSLRPVSSDGRWRMYKCKKCLTHFQFPSMQGRSLYDEDYFVGAGSDKLVDYSHIDEFEKKIFEGRIKNLIETYRHRSKYSERLNILDIGPGNGSFCITAQKFGDAYAIDITDSNEKMIRENGYCGSFMVNDLESASKGELSDLKNFFDIVHISEVVEHLSRPSDFFENVAYLIKENGVLFIQTGRSDLLVSMLCGRRWSYYRIVHSIIYSKKSIISILEKSGFEVLGVKRDFESLADVRKLITHNMKSDTKRCITYLSTYILGRCLPQFGRMQILARKTKANFFL
jgi:2-polyprenyl-3-methyl-5-hydroxy-6-metoxy-1,4-benzoquinol methylase